jgi:hypothetical protein
MSGFSIQHNLGALTKELAKTGSKAPAILARALNRAGTAGKTAMTRAIVKDTGIQSKNVSREIVLQRANWTNQSTSLTIRGARMPLIAFQARGPEPSRGRGKGVSYRLPGGRGRIPTAFIATMRSGHRGVFKRTRPKSKLHGAPPSRGQLPITELKGPSLPHVFAKFVESVFRPAALDAMLKTLRHEINRTKGPATGEGTEAA